MASLFRASSAVGNTLLTRGVRLGPALLQSGPYSGGGGHVRDSGGAFSEREKAAEEVYFRKQTQEQLKALRERMSYEKNHHEEEIKHHEEHIRRHMEAIERHKKKMAEHEAHASSAEQTHS